MAPSPGVTIHHLSEKELGWIGGWCALSAIAGFIAFGAIFATVDEGLYSSETQFNVLAAFGGAIAALVGCIPVCVIVSLLTKLVANSATTAKYTVEVHNQGVRVEKSAAAARASRSDV